MKIYSCIEKTKNVIDIELAIRECRSNGIKGIVFGAGYAGKIAMYLIKYVYHIRVNYCFDNDCSKWGKNFWNDIECIKPKSQKEGECIFIAVFDRIIAEKLKEQCKQLGYERVYVLSEADTLCIMRSLSDEEAVKIIYYAGTEEHLNLERPITFNEKLQWLKVYDHNPSYSKMTDKILVKEYVGKMIGFEHIIPTIGVWDKFEDIDFDSLPESFVLKCNHDSGSAEVINNKNEMDFERISQKFSRALSIDYYDIGREHAYKGIKRKIIAEPKINGNVDEDVKDYKVFTFGGVPRIVQVDYDRFKNHSRIMYSTDWQDLHFSTLYPYNSLKIESKPKKLEEILELATILSKGLPHIRADFYIVNEHVYFGELTFHHGGGLERFSDENWNYKMGEWLVLPDLA